MLNYFFFYTTVIGDNLFDLQTRTVVKCQQAEHKCFKHMLTFFVNIVIALNWNLGFDSVGCILLSEVLSSLTWKFSFAL